MKLTNETRIGLMVGIVIAVLAYLTVKSGNFNLSRDGYNIIARFNDIDGVNLNSPVMFNGYEVGVVEDIVIRDLENETKMDLLLWVKDEAKLREGAKVYIRNMGFMGEKYIGLTSGNRNSAYLPAGSVLLGDEQPKFEELVAKGNDIARDIQGIVTNLNERLEVNKQKIDDIMSHMDSTVENMASVTKAADERLKQNQQNIDDILASFKATSMNIEEMTQDLKNHPWKILHKAKEKTDNK